LFMQASQSVTQIVQGFVLLCVPLRAEARREELLIHIATKSLARLLSRGARVNNRPAARR
jgi:hypothetical protein